MISVVIATSNDEAGLAACLSVLVPGVVDGLIREVVIVDDGSTDGTLAVAEHAGCAVLEAPGRSRGYRLAAGARHARHGWLLFLDPATALADGWMRDVATFIDHVETGTRPSAGAAFSLAIDDAGIGPRLIEAIAALRSGLLRLPRTPQGWLVPKALYRARGGHRDLASAEDLDHVRRYARAERVMLRASAVGRGAVYRDQGYWRVAARDGRDLIRALVRRPATVLSADG